MAKFDLYLDGKIAQSNIDSPVVIKDLKPDTQYDDYSLTFAGKSDGESVSFKTKVQSVTGVSLDKTKLSIDTGKTATLKATVVPDNATNKGLNWASTDEAIATVDSKGVVTGVKAGTATIKVGTKDGNKSAEAEVTVKTPVVLVSGISLNKETTTIDTGKNETLKATIAPENATNKAVKWASDNADVATVDNAGKVIAVKAGTANVTATSDDQGKVATIKVTVKDPVVAVTGVSLDQAELSVEEGATAQLKATIAPGNATNKKVAWKSGNPETFTIDGNGKVTGVKAGSATAVATTDDGGKTAEAKVTVTAKPEPEPDPDPEEPAE